MIQEIAEQIKKDKIAQYWSLLESIQYSREDKDIIDRKISEALEKIKNTEELERILTIIEDLKQEINPLVSSTFNPNNQGILLLLLFLSMLEDFYRGLEWLNNLEKAKKTPEVYWPVLYASVDRLEGVLYRIRQIQDLTMLVKWSDIVAAIGSIFLKFLLETDQLKEQEQFHDEQVVIRRTLLSGLQLSRWIQEQSEFIRKMQAKEGSTELKM